MPKRSLDTIIRSNKPVEQPKKAVPVLPIIKKDDFFREVEPKQKRLGLHRNTKRKLKISLYILLPLIILIALSVLVIRNPIVQNVYKLGRLYGDGKYLILFQNNSELRGGGGFPGSFAVIEIKHYHLKSYYFEANIYKADNKFTQNTKIAPPAYFKKVFGPGNYLALRDANYSPDFSLAAQNVAHFYNLEYEGGPVNGVIGVNASLVRDLLKITGPIETDDGTKITSDNFFSQVQEKVEGGYFDNQNNITLNEPKSILKNMVPVLLSKLKTTKPIVIYRFVFNQLEHKNILFWFNDSRENRVINQNWAGVIPNNNNELVFVSSNNANGAKTSLSVSESLELTGSSSERDRQLSVTRSYNGQVSDKASVGATNNNYSYIILPAGSQVQSVSQDGVALKENDFEVTTIKNKVAIGLWTTTKPNQTLVTNVKYTLANTIKIGTINYEKQPGVPSEHLTVSFDGKTNFNGKVDQDKLIKIKP